PLFLFARLTPPDAVPLSLHAALPILMDTASDSILPDQGPATRPRPRPRRDLPLMEEGRSPDPFRAEHGFSAFVDVGVGGRTRRIDRKSTRLNSSHSQISYAVFCLKKK